MDINSYMLPTSLLFSGRNIYFFRNMCEYDVLCKIDLTQRNETNEPDLHVVDLEKKYKIFKNDFGLKYALYFVKDGLCKGK